MTQVIVNLALPVIADKVNAALNDVANNSLSTQSRGNLIKEELVSYVMRRTPNVYTVAETSRIYSSQAPMHCFSKEQHHRIDALIAEGIDYLLYRHRSWQTAAQSSTQGMEPSPSHWFG